MYRPIATALLALALGACFEAAPEPGYPEPCGKDRCPLAMWSEFMPPAEVQDALPFLERHGLRLFQAIHHDQLGDPGLAALFRAAGRRGIESRAWLLLDYPQGYWPNEENVDAFAAQARAFMLWAERERLPVQWITVDMELDWDRTHELEDELTSVSGIVEFARQTLDREAHLAARARYQGLVEEAHQRGFLVHCVTYPMVLDDHGDSDPAIQDVLNVPVEGIGWDQVSFMVYRSRYRAMWDPAMTSYLVYDYARDALFHYGERAALDLGITAPHPDAEADYPLGPGAPTGYAEYHELAEDIAAAEAAGVPSIHLYGLDFVLQYPEPERWFDTSGLPAQPPERDGPSEQIRELFSTLDLAFD